MLPDRVSNPGPLTYESGALPIALRGPALKKMIFYYFSMYFYGLNLGSPGKEPSWILGPHLNKIGKGLLGNASYPISSI